MTRDSAARQMPSDRLGQKMDVGCLPHVSLGGAWGWQLALGLFGPGMKTLPVCSEGLENPMFFFFFFGFVA